MLTQVFFCDVFLGSLQFYVSIWGRTVEASILFTSVHAFGFGFRVKSMFFWNDVIRPEWAVKAGKGDEEWPGPNPKGKVVRFCSCYEAGFCRGTRGFPFPQNQHFHLQVRTKASTLRSTL